MLDLGHPRWGDAEEFGDAANGQAGRSEFGHRLGRLSAAAFTEAGELAAQVEQLEGVLGHGGLVQCGDHVHVEAVVVDVQDEGDRFADGGVGLVESP